MTDVWTHPTLGDFTFDGYQWIRKIEVPAFNAFTYGRGRHPTPTADVTFITSDETVTPSEKAVALVMRVLANQQALVPAMTKALWDDFNGVGPRSGMWWHGSLDDVTDMIFDDGPFPPLDHADALLAFMRPAEIMCRVHDDKIGGPIVEITFSAAFEEEHGVGILTDGNRILGTGYAVDADVFDPE